MKLDKNLVCPTIICKNSYYHYEEERRLDDIEIILASSFPIYYKFLKCQPIYICGMSVPPLMVARIANEVYKQWLEEV